MEQCCDVPTHLSLTRMKGTVPPQWNGMFRLKWTDPGQLPVTGGHMWALVWFSDPGRFEFESWQDQKGSEGVRALRPTTRLSAGVQPETTREFAPAPGNLTRCQGQQKPKQKPQGPHSMCPPA